MACWLLKHVGIQRHDKFEFEVRTITSEYRYLYCSSSFTSVQSTGMTSRSVYAWTPGSQMLHDLVHVPVMFTGVCLSPDLPSRRELETGASQGSEGRAWEPKMKGPLPVSPPMKRDGVLCSSLACVRFECLKAPRARRGKGFENGCRACAMGSCSRCSRYVSRYFCSLVRT